jgi:hypothetical protein
MDAMQLGDIYCELVKRSKVCGPARSDRIFVEYEDRGKRHCS